MSQISIMDALVVWLNDGARSWSSTFTALRSNQPVEHLETSNDLSVVVFPGPRTIRAATRGMHEKRYDVYVAIMKKLDSRIDEVSRTSQQDVLMALTEEIEDQLYREQVMDVAVTDLSESFQHAPFIENELSDRHKFMSIIHVRYTVI